MQKQLQECGRSMVEILGVLAVIGVLSVAGLAGYNIAMNRHHANELLNQVSMRATNCMAQIQLGNELSVSEFGDYDGYKFQVQKQNGSTQFSLIVYNRNVSDGVCAQMESIIGDKGTMRIEEACTKFTFNDDLSPMGDVPENPVGGGEDNPQNNQDNPGQNIDSVITGCEEDSDCNEGEICLGLCVKGAEECSETEMTMDVGRPDGKVACFSCDFRLDMPTNECNKCSDNRREQVYNWDNEDHVYCQLNECPSGTFDMYDDASYCLSCNDSDSFWTYVTEEECDFCGGRREWVANENYPEGYGDCVYAGPCTDNTQICDGDNLMTCTNGEWAVTETCAYGCEKVAGTPVCLGPCTENATKCSNDGESLMTCVSGRWTSGDCAYGCLANGETAACAEPCEEYTYTCSGNNLMKCNYMGRWQLEESCQLGCGYDENYYNEGQGEYRCKNCDPATYLPECWFSTKGAWISSCDENGWISSTKCEGVCRGTEETGAVCEARVCYDDEHQCSQDGNLMVCSDNHWVLEEDCEGSGCSYSNDLERLACNACKNDPSEEFCFVRGNTTKKMSCVNGVFTETANQCSGGCQKRYYHDYSEGIHEIRTFCCDNPQTSCNYKGAQSHDTDTGCVYVCNENLVWMPLPYYY